MYFLFMKEIVLSSGVKTHWRQLPQSRWKSSLNDWQLIIVHAWRPTISFPPYLEQLVMRLKHTHTHRHTLAKTKQANQYSLSFTILKKKFKILVRLVKFSRLVLPVKSHLIYILIPPFIYSNEFALEPYQRSCCTLHLMEVTFTPYTGLGRSAVGFYDV